MPRVFEVRLKYLCNRYFPSVVKSASIHMFSLILPKVDMKAYFGIKKKCLVFCWKGERRIFTNFHRQVFCWTDQWYGMTMADIRVLEDRTKVELDEVMKCHSHLYLFLKVPFSGWYQGSKRSIRCLFTYALISVSAIMFNNGNITWLD